MTETESRTPPGRALDYSPRRIVSLLPHLIADTDVQAMEFAGSESKRHRPAFPCAPYESGCITRADLERGLGALTLDELTCVVCRYLLDMELSTIADDLEMPQSMAGILITTGLNKAARRLGWRPPSEILPN